MKSLAERVAAIDILVLDVDGILTDRGITYTDNYQEMKRFDVRDGTGLKLWREAGKRVAIITGRSSTIVTFRARELGIQPIIQGCLQKGEAFEKLIGEMGVHPERVCAMGDDLPDLPMFRRAGLAITVADACLEVRDSADYVVDSVGGKGAVREAIEWILKQQGLWDGMVGRYREE